MPVVSDGGTGFGIVGREGIFAFEADDEQADAECAAKYPTIGGSQVCADEAGDVSPSGRGDEQQQRDDGKGRGRVTQTLQMP
jgi:hypothetical protein